MTTFSTSSTEVGGNTDTPTSRHRNWCFTSYEEKAPPFNWTEVQYEVHQQEICPKTGKPHWQGYVQFLNGRSLGGLKKIDAKAHWEVRRGTHAQARDYCKKLESSVENTLHEFGVEKDDQGRRTDLEALHEDLKKNVSDQELSNIHFSAYVKYPRGIERWRQAQFTRRTEMPIVTLISGPSGSGKTRFVYDKHGYDNVYSVTDPKWWDGYRQQEAVLFDEVDFQERTTREWLQILDRYPYQVQVKGGFVPLNSKFIYIINSRETNLLPFTWGDMPRRIHLWLDFSVNPVQGVDPGLLRQPRAQRGAPRPPRAHDEMSPSVSPVLDPEEHARETLAEARIRAGWDPAPDLEAKYA